MTSQSETRRPLPGDPDPQQRLAGIIRVDHAGEFGAKRIYEGQLAILGRGRHGTTLRHMKEQEQVHLDRFSALIRSHRVRPSALMPFWHVAGYALGATTALLGERAAMACTVAVEEVIETHYARQLTALGDSEPVLREDIATFRAEEIEHRDIGLANQATQAPGYPLLSAVIKAGSRAAIWLAERL
ncbi:MAG: demethoxyubiquinone hydroxylase family protein [Azospirillaceae bacterium]|nr:demethoxyubiquinone hydroxylase family protein [Azospirillaceae bacterium]